MASLSHRRCVLIAPTAAVKYDDEPRFLTLPHPKTGSSAMFLLSNEGRHVQEVQKYEDPPKSWFMNNSVQRDGSLCLATPIDPLYLLLPFLEKSKRHFTTLDNILATGDPDGKFPNIQKIQQLDGLGHLSHICDMRSIDDSTVYRLNAEKTLEWLKKKVSKVVTKLKEMPEIYAGSGSRVSSFVQSHNKAASSKEDSEYIRYAVGLVSEYLPPEWTDRMKDEFKEHFDKEVHDEPVSKKAKRGSQSEECDDDYTKFNTKKTLEVEKPKKMTVAERALAKVDKTGMKTMASFFKPLSKKKST